MIYKFREILAERTDYSKNTINKFISATRAALSYAERDGYIRRNKLIGLRNGRAPLRLMFSVDKTRGRVLEVGEVTSLVNVAENIRQKTALSLAYYHGLCRGEIAWLRWQDIDLQEYRLAVVDHADHKLKTKNRSREVALREETATLLTQLYQDRVNEYVFEKPASFYHSVTKWLDRLVIRAKLDHCTLHDLRRTCNTVMKDNGVSEEVATQMMGHTAEVNRTHYTATLKQQQRYAIDAIPSVG